MRIRRNASRLLGSAVCAPPRLELPPPSEFELPPPADESHHAGFVPKISSSSSQEPCEESFSPWDLMDQLDLSDPQEEERFEETYFVPVPWRASWLLAPAMPAGSIEKEEQEKEHMVEDMIDVVLAPTTPSGSIEKEVLEKEHMAVDMVFLELHDAKRSKASRKTSRKKKNPSGNLGMDEGFYYYTGLGPSRSTKRQRSMLEAAQRAQDKEEEWLHEYQHIDVTPAQADKADNQVAPVNDEPRSADKSMAAIAGRHSSSDDNSVLRRCNGEPTLKKRWRKPVKVRSINSLM